MKKLLLIAISLLGFANGLVGMGYLSKERIQKLKIVNSRFKEAAERIVGQKVAQGKVLSKEEERIHGRIMFNNKKVFKVYLESSSLDPKRDMTNMQAVLNSTEHNDRNVAIQTAARFNRLALEREERFMISDIEKQLGVSGISNNYDLACEKMVKRLALKLHDHQEEEYFEDKSKRNLEDHDFICYGEETNVNTFEHHLSKLYDEWPEVESCNYMTKTEKKKEVEKIKNKILKVRETRLHLQEKMIKRGILTHDAMCGVLPDIIPIRVIIPLSNIPITDRSVYNDSKE